MRRSKTSFEHVNSPQSTSYAIVAEFIKILVSTSEQNREENKLSRVCRILQGEHYDLVACCSGDPDIDYIARSELKGTYAEYKMHVKTPGEKRPYTPNRMMEVGYVSYYRTIILLFDRQ